MHCHILPGIDDGSPDVETSLKMIEALQKQGAKKIVLTPHYYSNEISYDDFLKLREESFEKLKAALPEGSPELIPAAEVYISDYLLNNENIDGLKIGNSNYVLIEHGFGSPFDDKVYNRLMNLYCDYGIRPILAHIERYKALMEGKHKLDDFIEMGCLTQVNISSFSDAPRGIRKKLFRFLEEGKIHLIGSDCHNLDTRSPDYESGINAILKKHPKELIDTLISNANLITE